MHWFALNQEFDDYSQSQNMLQGGIGVDTTQPWAVVWVTLILGTTPALSPEALCHLHFPRGFRSSEFMLSYLARVLLIRQNTDL